MNYLAIDTSGEKVCVLLRFSGKSDFRTVNEHKTTSETLLPLIDEMLAFSGAKLNDMDFFACVTGPGSFTGIRLGVVTVKTFACVLNKRIVAVTSLEKLAYNDISDSADCTVCAVHAYADNCYLAAYSSSGSEVIAPAMFTYGEAQNYLATLNRPFALIADQASAPHFPSAGTDHPEKSLQKAVETAFSAGKLLSYSEVEPFYLLKSQAEREKGE